MLLKKLTLKDIGTYAGHQEFDLTPRVKYGAKRPIVLFGGLNGAGKTTFLSAVRLALYGRQSLDGVPSQKEYEEHLLDLIHRPRNFLVRAAEASVTLEFEHSKLGERATYKIVRYWVERAKGAEERLVVNRNGSEEPYLVDEQAQAFLNQLIPPGVAQFFFFDGEKIAALAKDYSDVVLADAIRRLLGLDLVDRLNSDLSIFLRNNRTAKGDQKTLDEVAELQSELDKVKDARKLLETEGAEINSRRRAVFEEHERSKAALSSQGGAWSVNRGALEQELEALKAERLTNEDSIREALNGVGIFAIAKTLGARVTRLLAASSDKFDAEAVHAAVRARKDELRSALLNSAALAVNDKKGLTAAIEAWISGFEQASSSDSTQLVLNGADARRAHELLSLAAQSEQKLMTSMYERARAIESQEVRIQDQLAHAPSDESLQGAMDSLTKISEELGKLTALRDANLEERRRQTWRAIELVRRLKKVEEKLTLLSVGEQGYEAAAALQDVIAEFKVDAAKHKCKLLQAHFMSAFKRLARKDDIVRQVEIDPVSFKVTLMDAHGREVPKKRLSAGEKQIYSISMLEALAKTSGRNLPVIIDTPLGRLDSKHRAKLVESYFPVASHQVIVLSTDTEVDAKFYEALGPRISHAFHLSFDEENGATMVEQGYFWRYANEENAYAA